MKLSRNRQSCLTPVWKKKKINGSKRVHMSKSQVKTILITFFDINGIVRFETTVNQVYYVDIVKQLHEVVRRKRPELWPSDWILHHDHAPAHKALSGSLSHRSITEMEHPPCSSELAPNNLWLVPNIKSACKGRRF
jgi:LmbE family N-acetylglucosaminyl deacetylase